MNTKEKEPSKIGTKEVCSVVQTENMGWLKHPDYKEFLRKLYVELMINLNMISAKSYSLLKLSISYGN